MRTATTFALLLFLVQGCMPEAQPPPASHPPAPAAAAARVQPADDRTLQTLQDLGVSPETMLQLVKNHLATSVTNAVAGQPPSESATAPVPATAPPVVQAPVPAADPAPVVPPQAQPAISGTPPPVPEAELPNVAGQTPPPVAWVTNTVVVREPVAVQQVQDFYTPLNNYGTWMDLPDYGRVWQPVVTVVNSGWRPYCQGGRWVYTNCGWYWQSDYSWGWAPFHYGRWCYVNNHRWVWVPDTVWAPAWVSWRRTESHCGWAPLPPGTSFRVGVGFTVGHDNQFDVRFALSSQHYTFVPNDHFSDQNVASVAIGNDRVDVVYRTSTFVPQSQSWDNREHRVRNDGPGRVPGGNAGSQPLPPARIVTAPVTPPRPVASAPVVSRPASDPVRWRQPVATAPEARRDDTRHEERSVTAPATGPRQVERTEEHEAVRIPTPAIREPTPAAHVPDIREHERTTPATTHEVSLPVVTRPVAPTPREPATPAVTRPALSPVTVRDPAPPVVTREVPPMPVSREVPAPVLVPSPWTTVPARPAATLPSPAAREPRATEPVRRESRSVEPSVPETRANETRSESRDRRDARETKAEPVAPTPAASRRSDPAPAAAPTPMVSRRSDPAPAAAPAVVVPKAEPADRPSSRTATDGSRVDGEDDHRPFKR